MKKIIYEIPLYLVMLIPFVVYGKLVDTGLEGFPWFSDNAAALDIFLYHKQSAVIIVSCMIVFWLTAMIIRKKSEYRDLRHRLYAFCPFAAYVMLAVASSLASPYREFAWKGMMEQFESIWVIVGYFLICVYSYIVCSKRCFIAFGIFSGMEGAVGTLQYFGMDIYRTDFLQKLCMPQSLRKMVFHITVERGRSYCSLSNPNYAGVFCCLTMPVLTALAVCSKKRWEKALYGAADALMLCSLIGSRSKSGMLILAGCMVILVVILVIHLGRQPVKKMIIFIMAIGLLAGLFAYRWDIFSDSENTPDTKIREISTDKDNVKITYNGKVLLFDVDYGASSLEDAVNIADEDGNPYPALRQGTLNFEDETLSQLTAALVKYGGYVALEIWDGNFYWYFTDQTEDGTWYYLTHYGKPDKLRSKQIEVYKKLEGRERIVSGRGYIWSRTIPLIKKYILLGSGQDSFAAVFPNDDYLGKAKWGYKDLIVTKPHSMYLQTAVQSGLLSLIVLLVFWGRFLAKAAVGKSDGMQPVLSKAVAVGVLGYLLMGLTNDSNVGTAPIFWMLLGMGMRL